MFVKSRIQSSKSFTLIELLVVIAIIGILAAVILVAVNTAKKKAQDTRQLGQLRQIVTALEGHYAEQGAYPYVGCGHSSDDPATWDGVYRDSDNDSKFDLLQTKLASSGFTDIPNDPTASYYYDNYSCPCSAKQYRLAAYFYNPNNAPAEAVLMREDAGRSLMQVYLGNVTAGDPDPETCAIATAKNFTGGGGPNLSDPLNWGGVLPVQSDTLVFKNSAQNVTWDAAFLSRVAGVSIDASYTGTITLARSLAVDGDFVMAGGTFLAASNVITVGGNWNNTAGTFTPGTGEVIMIARNGNKTLTTPVAGSYWTQRFYKLTINSGTNKVTFAGGTSAMASNALNITGEYEIASGLKAYCTYTTAITINSGAILSGLGTFDRGVNNTPASFTNNGTISVANFQYEVSGGATIAPILATTYGGSLTIYNSNPTTAAAVITNGTLTVGTDFTITHWTTTSTITLANTNNSPINVGGSWNSGTRGIYTRGSETVTFTSKIAGKQITTSSAFNYLTFNGLTGVSTWTLQSDLNTNRLTITAGKLIDNAKTVSVAGNISIYSSSTALTSTGTWILTANGNLSNPAAASAINTLQIADGVTGTRTGYVYVKKAILGTNSILAGSYYLYFRYPGNDPFVQGSGSNVTGGLIEFLLNSNITQGAINISASIWHGYSTGNSITMTGDWRCGPLLVFGSTSSKTEATAAALDTNGYNLSVNGDLRLGSGRTGTYTGEYMGKIYFRTGIHQITGKIYVYRSGTNNSWGWFYQGSNNITAGSIDYFDSTWI